MKSISPNQEYKSLIDYIVTQRHNYQIINYNIHKNFNFYTDYRLLTAILDKKIQKKTIREITTGLQGLSGKFCNNAAKTKY